VQRGARIETARKRDPDLFADGKALEDVRHFPLMIYAVHRPPSRAPVNAAHLLQVAHERKSELCASLVVRAWHSPGGALISR
jgi:hypothetical protein